MPFLLNVLYDTGLGPITLDPTYYGQTPTPVYPHLWLAVTFISSAAAAVFGLLLSLSVIRFRGSAPDQARDNFLLFSALSFLSVIAFEVIFSHTQEGGLFDRHILTAALPLFFLVALSGERSRDPKSNEVRQKAGPVTSRSESTPRYHLDSGPHIISLSHIGSAAAGLALGTLAWFSITATHDYLAWNRVRWDLGNQLLAAKVDPLTVSGGFEFNAWHNYDTFRARGNIGKVYYWWYDRLDYLITMEPQEAYHILQKKEYFSWLHRTNLPIYLLERDKPD